MFAEQKADIVLEITNNYNKINKMMSSPQQKGSEPIQPENQFEKEESEESLFSFGEYHFVKKIQKLDEKRINMGVSRQVQMWKMSQLYKNIPQHEDLIMFLYQLLGKCLEKLLNHCINVKNRRQKFQNVFQRCTYKIQAILNILRDRQNELNSLTELRKLENVVKYLKVVKGYFEQEEEQKRLKFINMILRKQDDKLRLAVLKKIVARYQKGQDQQRYSQDSFNPERCQKYRAQYSYTPEQLLSDLLVKPLRKRLFRIKKVQHLDKLLNNFDSLFPQENNKQIETAHKGAQQIGGTSLTQKHDYNVFADSQDSGLQKVFQNQQNIRLNEIKPQNKAGNQISQNIEEKIKLMKRKN